jgi:hypothetical protein
MWMAVLRKECYGYKAGAMFAVSKDDHFHVVVARYLDVSRTPVVVHPDHKTLSMTQPQAKLIFTKPTKDLTSLMEESIMVCESVYC